MPQVHQLIRELAIYEKEEHQLTNTVEQLIRDGFSDPPLFSCIVAEKKEQIVGFALFYTSYSTWKGKSLYLEDLLVTEAERRSEIGTALFDELLKIARSNGAKRFEWQVLDWNEPAINFYKKYKANLDPNWINGKIIL